MKHWLINLTLLFTLLMPGLALAGQAAAVDLFPSCDKGGVATSTNVCKDVTNQAKSKNNPLIHAISVAIDIVSYIVGIAAIIGLIVSGLRMIISNGDPSSMASARNGILYSLIGIVVTVLAQTIVVFVLDNIK